MTVPSAPLDSVLSDASATVMLDPGPRPPVPRRLADEDDPVLPGRTIGRYVVLELLGRGGMGTVVRAYDPRLHREVALKRLRADTRDPTGEARLLREAQAMAQLNHPNVVAVYDVEVDAGSIVVVMEYVQGRTLREWIPLDVRPWRDVVSVLSRAGRGLAAAHAAGLVHRDFKPANVLVTDDGRVAVGDFGLARATASPSEEENAPAGPHEGPASREELANPITRPDVVVGTPVYMAPEQHAGAPASAAADQYAFCITAWESLCGARPFPTTNWQELLAAKRSGPPPWPQTTSVPRRIADALRRGLHPSPEARWPSMDALLEAIAPDSRTARRGAWIGAGILGIGVAGGLWWTAYRTRPCEGAEQQLAEIWQDERRTQIRDAMLATGLSYASGEWEQVEAKIDAHAGGWIAQHREACEATAVRGEQSAEALDLRMACLRSARSELAAATAVLADADADVVMRADEIVAALPDLDRCADVPALREDVPPPTDPELARAVEGAAAALSRVRAEVRAGRYVAAQRELDAVRPVIESLEWPPLRARLLATAGTVLERSGRYAEAEEVLHEAMRDALAARDTATAIEATRWLTSVVGDRQGRPAEALWIGETALGLARAHAPDSFVEAEAHGTLGVILEALHRFSEAEHQHRLAIAMLERNAGASDPAVAQARNNLGIVLEMQGRFAEAEVEERTALRLWEATLGPEHPDVGMVRNNLAALFSQQGRLVEAEAELRTVVEVRSRQLGPEHPQVATARSNLASVLAMAGRTREAEAEFEAALRMLEASLGRDHPSCARLLVGLSDVLRQRGELARAEVHVRRALALLETSLDPNHPEVVQARETLAELVAAGAGGAATVR